MKRSIINIDENKCNGCGLCVTGCPEGAIQLINGKARLAAENYCDGLGACIGECPEGAITIEEREAAPYSESQVLENMLLQGMDVVRKHMEHLLDHKETRLYNEAIEFLKTAGVTLENLPQPEPVLIHGNHGHGCPGSMNRILKRGNVVAKTATPVQDFSYLNQWPVKLKLLSPDSPVFSGGVDLLISADCAPYAYGNFHEEFLKGRIMVTFCPKLDPYIDEYREKLAAIITNHDITTITIARMEVPCCGGVTALVREAVQKSGKKIMPDERVVKIV